MRDLDTGIETIALARRVAAETLGPGAEALARPGGSPRRQLDALAAAGLYGLAGPVDRGGLGATLDTAVRTIEILGGACLTTTFVWIQHHGVVRALMHGPAPLRGAWLGDLCAGRRRGGVVLAGLKPGPVALRAEPAGERWRLTGEVPWFTGHGLVDTMLVAARTPRDEVLTALLDLRGDAPAPAFAPAELIALDASATGSLRFAGILVAGERVLAVEPAGDWSAGGGLRMNGALALGLADRCLSELAGRGEAAARDELARLRAALLEGPDESVADTRAELAALALRCAGALLAAQGAHGILAATTAARLYREAGFLLTFGQRPAIRSRLLAELTGAGAGPATGVPRAQVG